MMRLSFQTIKKETKPLDMILSDTCNLKIAPMRSDNKYFIIFVYDNSNKEICSL